MAARTLSIYALCSKAELKRSLGMDPNVTGSDLVEDTLDDCIEFASDEAERYLGRNVVTRRANDAADGAVTSLTEYHTASEQFPQRLYLRQYPVITITSVDEGYWDSGAWVSQDTLAASEDYLSDTNAGTLIRISGSGSTSWDLGFERVRVVYTAGYANTAAAPATLRRICVSLATRRYAELTRGHQGAQTVTDGMGSVTRFLPAELLTMERQALDQFKRFLTTGRAA